jgi:nucleoside-diphosphate-sugar epimerase
MNKQQAISVVGCGWLGQALAESLAIKNFQVRGTTTTPSKLEILKNKGIDPYLVHFEPHHLKVAGEVLDSDILIINIPPRHNNSSGLVNYQLMTDYFTQRIPESRVQKVILVSSTSVYKEANAEIFESTLAEADSPSAISQLATENKFLDIKNKRVCVVRSAGLVGPERHPGRFFKNRSNIPNGLAPVNLIHRDDVIGIIQMLVDRDEVNGIYNACSPTHPPKQDFYRLAALSSGFTAPDFIPEILSWKIISSLRVFSELEYHFKYPDLTSWLEETPTDL